MTLIPQEIQHSIPDLYETEDTPDPICHVKLFLPGTEWTWYIIEFSKKDSMTCFGFVQGLEDEFGYFSLDELSSIRGSLGLKVERDLLFQPTPLSKIKN